jgi:hypothetical protein
MSTVRSTLLEILSALKGDESISPEEILRLATEPSRSSSPPTQSVVSGRLSDLVREGIVEKPDRGRYRLTRTSDAGTPLESEMGSRLQNVLRKEHLSTLVLWEATPYLEWNEDGPPGTRLVVEYPEAKAIQGTVLSQWPQVETPEAWTTRRKGPIGSALWDNPDQTMQPGRPAIVFVASSRKKTRGKTPMMAGLGGTALAPAGYRRPLRERVLCEFLGKDLEPELAKSVIDNILLSTQNTRPLEFKRLQQAAEAIKVEKELTVLLTAAYSRLPSQIQRDLVKSLPPSLTEILEGRP